MPVAASVVTLARRTSLPLSCGQATGPRSNFASSGTVTSRIPRGAAGFVASRTRIVRTAFFAVLPTPSVQPYVTVADPSRPAAMAASAAASLSGIAARFRAGYGSRHVTGGRLPYPSSTTEVPLPGDRTGLVPSTR